MLDIVVPEWSMGIGSLDYRSDGKQLVATGWGEVPGRHALILDGKTGERIKELTGHTEQVYQALYSPDGSYIVTGSKKIFRYSHLWDAESGAFLRQVKAPPEPFVKVGVIAFHPTDQRIAAHFSDYYISVFGTTPNLQKRVDLLGIRDDPTNATFSPDGTRLAACSVSETAIWDVQTGALLLTLPHGANDVAFSPDGRILATAGLDGRIGLWHSLPWK
jgi:WD40 repeat protein